MVKPKLLYQVVWVTALRMFSCALMSAVFIPDCGFIYRSSALYRHFSCFCRDCSWWPSSYECSASNVWYCKKSFQLFLNLQGSSNNNEIDHVYLTFLVSIAIFMQTTKGKNEKKDYNNKNVSSKNEPFFFKTKSATLWSLVIFGNYPSDALTF